MLSVSLTQKVSLFQHGGDHFTILFAASASAGAAAADPQPDEPFVLHHWNGLPPHGPRMATLTITAPAGVAEEVEEGEREDSFKPPVPGEIENIVQAVEADKKERPDMFETWRYEVVLAVPDPDGSIYGEGLPHTEEDLAYAARPLPRPASPQRLSIFLAAGRRRRSSWASRLRAPGAARRATAAASRPCASG